MQRGTPSWTPFSDRFFIDFCTQLRPPEPSKSLFFLWKNKVFSKNHPSKLASIFDAIWVPTWLHFPSKIQQNPIKIKSQEAFKNWLILASIFDRFGLRFGSQVGAMLPTKTPPRRPKTPPRRPTKLSRRPQDTKTPSRGPKTPPRPPKIPPRPLKTAPGSAQEPPEVLINWRGGTKAQPSTIYTFYSNLCTFRRRLTTTTKYI